MAKPLLFITGFLGAGKTTLLRALLSELRELGRSADVILNDYENADIDASTLQEKAASVSPIAASCACCDSLDDLVKLCLAAQGSEGDVVLIELNGTADPLPLLETFTIVENRMPFHPRWQVGAVDARFWGQRGDFSFLEKSQVQTATHWLLTHAESLGKEERDQLVCSVEQINPFATQIDPPILAGELDRVLAVERGEEEEIRLSEKLVSRDHDHDHDHDHERNHSHRLAHRFTGCQFPMPGRYDRSQMIEFLEALPEEVVRAKALVSLTETPGREIRWLFERTGSQPVLMPQPVEGLARTPASLVCIGPDLIPEKVTALAERYLAD